MSLETPNNTPRHYRSKCKDCVEGTRFCPHCQIHLTDEAFRSKLQGWCDKCYRLSKRLRYQHDEKYRKSRQDKASKHRNDNIERYKYNDRRRSWAKQGMNPDDAQAVLESHSGYCDSCGTTDPGSQGWIPDHSHTTGKVRGVLCRSCNISIGIANDDPVKLLKMSEYLRRVS